MRCVIELLNKLEDRGLLFSEEILFGTDGGKGLDYCLDGKDWQRVDLSEMCNVILSKVVF